MQQVWLCILSGKRIEETFENTLCGHSGDKTNRYDQCDYACHDSSNLRKHMKVETSQINAISVTMHSFKQAIWKRKVEKSCTGAISVIMHPLMQALWIDIWKHTVEKSNKCNQCDYTFFQAGNLREYLKTIRGKFNKCSQSDNFMLLGKQFDYTAEKACLRLNLYKKYEYMEILVNAIYAIHITLFQLRCPIDVGKKN